MPTEIPAEGTPTPAKGVEDAAAYHAGLNALLRGEVETPEDPPPGDPKKDGDPAPGATDEEPDAGDDDPEEPDAPTEEEGEGDEDEEPVDKDELRKRAKERRTFETYKAGVLEKERTVEAREQKVAKGEKELMSFFDELNSSGIEALLNHQLIPQDRMAAYSRQLFLLSPEGLKDPRSRPEAERLRAEMARDAQTRQANARVEKLEKEREAEKAQAQADREATNYVAQIDASLVPYKAKTPLLAKAMETDARETKRELLSIASELAAANGDRFVEPGKVLLAWEKRQRGLIARLGLSPGEQPPATQNKAKTKTAAKKQGQGKNGTSAPAAEEPAEEKVPEAGSPEYYAELRRRLNQK
jgi:hypothetical protein